MLMMVLPLSGIATAFSNNVRQSGRMGTCTVT